jgi:hypothetical protein
MRAIAEAAVRASSVTSSNISVMPCAASLIFSSRMPGESSSNHCRQQMANDSMSWAALGVVFADAARILDIRPTTVDECRLADAG